MTTTTQQIPSNPALDFANAVLAETDGGREIVLMLHDIAQGVRENATTNDRINASNILIDGGLGKCPKKASATTSPNPNPSNDKPKAKKQPKSPRLVTQLGDSLHRSFGPPPEAHSSIRHSRESGNPQSHSISHSLEQENPEPFDPYSIQKHILEITNNCLTLMSVLTDIYRAPDDDPKVKDSHRVRAGRMLVDRIMAMYPTAVRRAVDGLVLSGDYSEPGRRIQDDDDDEPFDEELWDEIIAELKQKEEAGIITPDPDAHIADAPINMPPEGFDETILAEEAAKFRAQNALRIERRKKWPEIEERRRKKLAQTYPSHSEGQPGDPPDI